MLESNLEAIVLKNLRDKAQSILDNLGDSPKQQAECGVQVRQLEDAKRVLYERFVLDEVTAG